MRDSEFFWLTDITPDGCPIDRTPVPYGRVDEIVETPKTGPCHEETRSCIPS